MTEDGDIQDKQGAGAAVAAGGSAALGQVRGIPTERRPRVHGQDMRLDEK
jgi:hypothetical protein